MNVLNLTYPFDNLWLDIRDTSLRLSLSVNHFSETNIETDGLINTNVHYGDWNRRSQIGTVVKNWEGTIITAIYDWQKRVQESESSLTKSVSLHPWNVSLGLNRRLTPALWFRGCSEEMAQAERSTATSPAGQARTGPHADPGLIPKAGPQVTPEQLSPAWARSSVPHVPALLELSNVSVQTLWKWQKQFRHHYL